MTPLVKICGITNLEDAQTAVAAGANYLGLNFFPTSPRYLTPGTAENLGNEIKKNSPEVKLVGVFVNENPETINKLAELAALDLVQLHGDESPEDLKKIRFPIWKAFRVLSHESLADLTEFLGCDGIVLDAYKKGLFGGTGGTANWKIIREVRKNLPFFILAGGLTPANVRQAVNELSPDVVDVCSGVEIPNDPRRKDPEKIQQLFAALRAEK